MTVSQNLYLAILALDAYNQGSEPSLAGVGNQIGAAQKLLTRDVLGSGFSASQYTLDGKTIISYRGTDDPLGSFSGSDVLNGWSIAAGYSGASQAALAMQFYKDVTGHDAFDGRVSNVILTGHSLGGGLAEMVGGLSGTDATVVALFQHDVGQHSARDSMQRGGNHEGRGIPGACRAAG